MTEQLASSNLQDLLGIIHFTESVSAEIHGILDEAEIFKTVDRAFKKSKLNGSIHLLAKDGRTVKPVFLSYSQKTVKNIYDKTGVNAEKYEINLEKSGYYRQVINKGKTVQVKSVDVVKELFPRLSRQLVKLSGDEDRQCIITPLTRNGEIIGALTIASTELVERHIPSVKSLASHVSSALNCADRHLRMRQAETKLNASLMEMEKTFDAISDYAFTLDADFRIQRVNRATCEALKKQPDELIGRRCFEVLHGKNEPLPDCPLIKTLKTKKEETGEVYDPLTNRTLLVSNSPILNDDGEISHSVHIVKDITERKRMEENLEKFKLGIERSGEIVFLTEKDGSIIYVNPMFEKVYGYRREEALGKTPRILKSGTLAPEIYEQFWDRLLAKKIMSGDIINKTKEGRLKTIDSSVNPIMDDDGNITGFLAIQRDITERKKVEATIRDLAKFPSEDMSPVLRIARKGVLLYANTSAECLLRKWQCKVGDPVPENLGKYVTYVLKANERVEIEESLGDRTFALTLTPIQDAGYVNVYGQDIT